MAKYTVELYTLVTSPNFKLFDFEYDFYEESAKEKFEDIFTDYYMFNEIGFETVARFKHQLKTKLNFIMPYYKKLYETELAAKDINFLLNKDLKESFTRNLKENEIGTVNSTYTANAENNSSTSASSDSNSKESYLDNGNADLSLTDGLTGVTNNLSEGSTSSTSKSSDSNTSTNNSSNNNTTLETTELISQGNIGITSSAELLQKWRDTIINIDKMIIDECKDLFMQIY